MDLNTITGGNFTILIGVFVTLAVMGTATLYDKHKSKEKTSMDTGELKSSSDLNEKIKSYSSKVMNGLSEFSKKVSNLIPKKANENNLENSEIKPSKSGNTIKEVILKGLSESSKKFSSLIPKKGNKNNLENSETKSLKSSSGIPKIFGTIRSKISSFSFTQRGKKNKLDSEIFVPQSNKKVETSKLSGTDKVSGFGIGKIAESNRDELDFDDNIPNEMSIAGINNNQESLNSDLTFDKDEVDIGFGAVPDESSEDDLLFDISSEKTDSADEHDSFLDSLKKDIVIKKEKKNGFMSEMQGQNLDSKLIKSDLQDVLKKLKKYKQYSDRN